MLEKISKEEMQLIEMFEDPLCAAECLFSDIENLSHEPEMQLGHIRFAQIPMLSFEYLIDEDPNLSKKENFKLKEGAGNIDCFGGRLFGKTHIVETVDILLSILHLPNMEVGFTSTDHIHIKGILEEKVIPVLEKHPFFKLFNPKFNRSPNYRISCNNGYVLIGINMNLQAKQPGSQFFQRHLKRLYLEEASFETEEVFNKRIDAVSEDGCVIRSAGMTNFTKYSPAGRRFYDLKNKPWVCNLPQYCVGEDSLILMHDYSQKKIKDIKIGDRIITVTEKAPYKIVEAEVLNVFDNGVKETVKINNSLDVTLNHKILQRSANDNHARWLQIKKIKDTSFIYKFPTIKNIKETKTLKTITQEQIVLDKKLQLRKVFDLQTTAGTYVANGIVVHNCNPKWDKTQKEKAIKKHGGENSVSYRIFVKGEVVEEGISVFDMERVRAHYLEDKIVKKFEITKENYHNFRSILIVEKPETVKEAYIMSDIGESAATEIIIIFKIGEEYKYLYNITCYNLTDKQQTALFDFLIQATSATCVGIDTTDGTGRAIFRNLNEKYPSDNLVWCSFNEKISVGYEKNESGQMILDDKGNLILKEEYVSEWSISHLKNLLYDGILKLPVDYKLDKQLNSVISSPASAGRMIYEVVGDEDHLFSAFRVFAIAEWTREFSKLKPMASNKFYKGGV